MTSSNEFNSMKSEIFSGISKEVSLNYQRIIADKNVIKEAQSALIKYQQARKRYEIMIYDVFVAIKPQKQGGQPSSVRMRMEVERDQQKAQSDQFRQEYDSKLRNLDNIIQKYKQNNQNERAQELINKKLKLFYSELNNRKDRNEELSREITTALRPRKEGGLYREHREALQHYQTILMQNISQLEQKIHQIQNS